MMVVAPLSLLGLMHASMHLWSLRFSPSHPLDLDSWPDQRCKLPPQLFIYCIPTTRLGFEAAPTPLLYPTREIWELTRALAPCFLPDLRPSTLESLASLRHPLIPYQTCTFISKLHSIISPLPWTGEDFFSQVPLDLRSAEPPYSLKGMKPGSSAKIFLSNDEKLFDHIYREVALYGTSPTQ
jgi:hypothetical protein